MKKSYINDGYYKRRNRNYAILVLADKSGWKLATKTKGIIARRLEEDAIIHSTEGPLQAQVGQFVCHGVNTQIKPYLWWAQNKEVLTKKYIRRGIFKESVFFDGKTYKDFYLYLPKPDKAVLVCRMPAAFTLDVSGQLLKGKKGDFLVKFSEDKLNPDPKDMWLIDQGSFTATYIFK